MLHKAQFDGATNDILAVINPGAKFPQIFSPSSSINVNNALHLNVERLISNRVISPTVDVNDEIKDKIISIIEETKLYINKEKNSNIPEDKKRYINGISESLSVMCAYIESDKDIYDIVDDLKDVVILHTDTYNKMINSSKPFYAGLLSGLMNFLDMLVEEIKAQETQKTIISTTVTRQINTPDMLFRNNDVINLSNDYIK